LVYLEKRRRISQCNFEVEYAYNLKFVSTTTNPWEKEKEARDEIWLQICSHYISIVLYREYIYIYILKRKTKAKKK
jgi:hypothetical protein